MTSTACQLQPPDPNNNNSPEKCYSLRPRGCARRGDDDDEEVSWVRRKRRSKGSTKPAPLSKYRRKTANARERSRMREINEAFESLRRAVPVPRESEKLTKISTLRLAMKYITALSQLLSEPESDAESCSILSDSFTDNSLTPPLMLDPFPYPDLDEVPIDTYTDFPFSLDEPFPTDFT